MGYLLSFLLGAGIVFYAARREIRRRSIADYNRLSDTFRGYVQDAYENGIRDGILHERSGRKDGQPN